jgi:O-antigen/teichoic acid export membrane protein
MSIKDKISSLSSKVLFKVSMVSAGNIANAVMGFIFLTVVARALSLDSFGKYALLTSLLTLIGRIMDFGTNSLFVSDHSKEDKRATFLFTKILLFIVTLPIAYLTLRAFSLDTPSLLVIFALGLVGYGINFTLYAYYQKPQKYFEAVLLNTIPSIIKIIYAAAIILGYMQLELNTSFAIFTYSVFGSLLVYLISPISLIGEDKNTSWTEIISQLKKAVSPGLSQLIYESWSSVNNALTKIYNTFSDVGVFSMANKISNIFYLLSFSIFTVLLPKNAERKTNKKGYDFYETGVLSAAVFVMALAAIVVSEIFLTRVFGDKFQESMNFLALLIFANAITAVQNFIENYFYVEKYTDYLAKINITKLVLLISISAVTIPVYGLTSLAVANLVAAIVGISITFVLVRKIELSKAI